MPNKFIGSTTDYPVVTPAGVDTIPLMQGGVLKQASVSTLAGPSGALVAGNNLSDVVSPATGRANLGVDAAIAALPWKLAVRAATTAALPANTYNNGASGVGATLTGSANGALPAQDGVTLVAGDRLLVKNEAAAANNGPYVVTQVGTAGTPYILTRATDSDSAAELVSAVVLVSEGTTLADSQWTCTTNAPITVGTTAIAFSSKSMDTVTVLTISAGVVNIDCSLGDYFTLALTANVTGMTFSNLPGAGFGASKMVRITQGGGFTFAWPASFRWEGAAPSVSTASGAVDVLALTSFDNGTKWDATLSKGRV